jgi:hypothetical protein
MVSAATSPAPFRLNFGEAFTFPFRDPHWLRKFGIAALFSLLGFLVIPYLLLSGYFLTLSERVMRLEPTPLPAWTDFGALLRKGWRVFLVRVVYYAPIWLITLIMAGIVLFVIISLGGLSIFGGSVGSPVSLAPLWLLLLVIPLVLLLIPLGLLIPCITPAADAQLVLHEGQLEPAFRFGAVFAFIRRHLGQYALMVILYVGATQALSSGSSAGFQVSGGVSDTGEFNLAFFVILGSIALIVFLVVSLIGLYLRCALAHMIGQLCWHERMVRGHEH